MSNGIVAFVLTTTGVFALAVLTTLGLWGCPMYNVYSSRLQGQAMLAHAQSSKEVAVAEARAKMLRSPGPGAWHKQTKSSENP